MERKENLLKYISNIDENKKMICEELIDDILFLEQQLRDIKKLPFIKINPENIYQQKKTPASKLYKELSQSYINELKVLQSITKGEEEETDDSILFEWLKNNNINKG